MPITLKKTITALSLLLLPSIAQAWGPVGHRMITETAALLTNDDQPKGWGDLLARHRFEMGFYSTTPDSVFRFNDGKNGGREAPLHYFNLDLLTGTPVQPQAIREIDAVPRQYEKAKKHLETKVGKNKLGSVGALPWRIQQFDERIKQRLKNLTAIKGRYQPGGKAEGDTRRVFITLYELGILSHYTADTTMPYHVTIDSLGFGIGQGGNHFYIENDCINALEPGLSTAVLEEAHKQRESLTASWKASNNDIAGLIMNVAFDTAQLLPEFNKLDREKAILLASTPGTSNFAIRRPAREACPAFRELLIKQLAKGAVLTAYLWQEMLPKNVDFTEAASLQFADLAISDEYISPNFNIPVFLKWPSWVPLPDVPSLPLLPDLPPFPELLPQFASP